jgi:glycosyltransferase involved in cell wall biosynthesis
LRYFDPGPAFERPFAKDAQAIVMTGLMDYWPNIQAAEWFANRVMPLLAQKLPHACFYVVGANPAPGFLKQIPRVVVSGRVPDVRPYLAHAAVAVAPLQIARGVQNKVLEAMAMGRPVVASGAAIRALEAVPGRDLLVADQAQDFAQAVVRAVQPPLAQALGAHGRSYVERHHDWGHSLVAFDELLESLGRSPMPAPRRQASCHRLPARIQEAP